MLKTPAVRTQPQVVMFPGGVAAGGARADPWPGPGERTRRRAGGRGQECAGRGGDHQPGLAAGDALGASVKLTRGLGPAGPSCT